MIKFARKTVRKISKYSFTRVEFSMKNLPIHTLFMQINSGVSRRLLFNDTPISRDDGVSYRIEAKYMNGEAKSVYRRQSPEKALTRV